MFFIIFSNTEIYLKLLLKQIAEILYTVNHNMSAYLSTCAMVFGPNQLPTAFPSETPI